MTCDLYPFNFCLWGHLENLVHSVPYENQETLRQLIFSPVKPFATAPGSLNWCDSPKADLAVRALKKVEDVLSICCEL